MSSLQSLPTWPHAFNNNVLITNTSDLARCLQQQCPQYEHYRLCLTPSTTLSSLQPLPIWPDAFNNNTSLQSLPTWPHAFNNNTSLQTLPTWPHAFNNNVLITNTSDLVTPPQQQCPHYNHYRLSQTHSTTMSSLQPYYRLGQTPSTTMPSLQALSNWPDAFNNHVLITSTIEVARRLQQKCPHYKHYRIGQTPSITMSSLQALSNWPDAFNNNVLITSTIELARRHQQQCPCLLYTSPSPRDA